MLEDAPKHSNVNELARIASERDGWRSHVKSKMREINQEPQEGRPHEVESVEGSAMFSWPKMVLCNVM